MCLMVVETVFVRGNKANVGVAQLNKTVSVAVFGIHIAKGIGIEAYRVVGIYVGIAAVDLRNVDLTAGKQNVRLDANCVVNTKGRINKLFKSTGSFVVYGLDSDLVKNNGQDLLIDVDLKELGAVGILDNVNADVFGGVPAFLCCGVKACSVFNGISSVGILCNGIDLVENLNSLNVLDLHVSANAVGIDQGSVFNAGCANLGAGYGVEGVGCKLLIDLVKGFANVCGRNVLIIIDVVDIGCDICGCNIGCGPFVVEGPGCGAGFYSRGGAGFPSCECLPCILDIGVGIFFVKTRRTCCAGVQENVVRAGRFKVNADTVDLHGRTVVLFDFGLAVCRVKQGTEHNARIAA